MHVNTDGIHYQIQNDSIWLHKSCNASISLAMSFQPAVPRSPDRNQVHRGQRYSTVMTVIKRLAIFLSLLVFVFTFALAFTGLITEYWITVQPLERNGKTLANSYVHSGLFIGERQLDYGLGPSHEIFSVYREITTKTSFFNKLIWIFTLFFIALGLFWTFIGTVVALINTVIDEKPSILGPSGIYLWCFLSMLSFATGLGIFVLQFFTTIRKNVLLPEHLEAGFSSLNQAELGFSFYLIAGAIGALFIPMVLIFVSNSTKQVKKTNPKAIPIDTTVFMY
uniref:DUF2975 domain-containing protein n=1 Tax=Panagrellus redivivus TaxID=6233 RepID=A0A7E4UY65_PANRE